MKQLENKIALVTGGNSGIGLATAKRFKDVGATVIITARSNETFAQAQAEFGNVFDVIQTDVSKLQDLGRLMTTIERRYGRIDVLVANAGISTIHPLSDFSESSYDQLFDTNVKSVFFTVQKADRLLSAGASVILTASAASSMGFPGGAAYGATKAALNAFARHFAAEFAARKIRFNSISPALIDTPIQTKFTKDPATLEAVRAGGRRNPLGRIGEADEVAQSILFLASSQSSFINGIELVIDGGGKAVPAVFDL